MKTHITYEEFLKYAKTQLWTRIDMSESVVLKRVRPEDYQKASKYIEVRILVNDFKNNTEYRSFFPALIQSGMPEDLLDKPAIEAMLHETQEVHPELVQNPSDSLLYSVLMGINPTVGEKFKDLYEKKHSSKLLINLIPAMQNKVVPRKLRAIKLLNDQRKKINEDFNEVVQVKVSQAEMMSQSLERVKELTGESELAQLHQEEFTEHVNDILSIPKRVNKDKIKYFMDVRGTNTPEDFIDENKLTKESIKQLNDSLSITGKQIKNNKLVGN